MAIAGMDESGLRRAFLEEAEDLHAKLSQSLLGLEQAGGSRELLDEAFRLVHSLKSESALMGFARLAELAHSMEDVLGLAREGRDVLDRAVMDLLFSGADIINAMLGAIAGGANDEGFPAEQAMQGLAAAAAHTQGPAAAARPAPAAGCSASPAIPGLPSFDEFERQQIAEARDRGESLYRLAIRVEEGEPMKFPRVYLVFNTLETTANLVRSVPALVGEPLDDALYAETALYLTTRDGPEAVAAAVRVDQVAVATVQRLDFAEVLAEGIAAPCASPPGLTGGQGAGAEAPPGGFDFPLKRPGTERPTIRVDTRKLDDLWSMVAELVTRKSRVARLSEKMGRGADSHEIREELADSSDSLEKIAGGMQRVMMDTRMIPISVIFSKFPRLMRDLSRKLGKSIELELAGEETEIDRGLVDALSDPLTHLIRNAVDHGIEFPEERVRLGKPARGRLSVSARQQGGTIVVEIADDGRGIDLSRVRQKAVAEAIAGAEQMGEAALLELVFRPGFSTREVVTDVSGRGVGMDVVATRIRTELKGGVSLATEKGRGTRVTLLLPLTLTIVTTLLVRADGQLYAIPITDVDSTVKILNTEIRGDEERETWVDREEEIPLYRLGSLVGRSLRRAEEHFAVILHHGGHRGCLVVDELIEERQIVIKPVDDLLNDRRLFSGVSLLEDGELVFILDTSFIRQHEF